MDGHGHLCRDNYSLRVTLPFVQPLSHTPVERKIAIDRIKPDATVEALKLQKGGERVAGVHVSAVNGKRTFDYSEDKEWCNLKEKLREREALLKGLPKDMADPETGEIISPPIIKYSPETINLKFE